jgi:hypothetical protein
MGGFGGPGVLGGFWLTMIMLYEIHEINLEHA